MAMFLQQARAILQDVISPEPYDHFFDEVMERRPLALTGNPPPARLGILGDDPKQTLLAAFETQSAQLTCHAGKPSGPPPAARQVGDASAFQELVREYHQRDYTIRFPDVTSLSPALQRIVRALEVVFRKPVAAPAFWSEAGATAPVHRDEEEILVIQLSGRKRWFISNAQATLPNQWKMIGEGPPPFDAHQIVDMGPGDLLYMPRGTAHTVHSTTESIHLSIGFVPMTVREAVIAVLDHVSDLDRPLRAGIAGRADEFASGEVPAAVPSRVREGLQRLIAACGSDSFIREAIEHRMSRSVGDLAKLPTSLVPPNLTVNSRVRHSPLALAHLIATPQTLDFSYPGGHLLVHPGAEESLQYVIANPEFRIGDVPGGLAGEVQIALVSRLIATGVLEPA
jgi:mannose-6-phosphate isomerase-like protein (cupin superfamily)